MARRLVFPLARSASGGGRALGLDVAQAAAAATESIWSDLPEDLDIATTAVHSFGEWPLPTLRK